MNESNQNERQLIQVDEETAKAEFDRFCRAARRKMDRIRDENSRRDLEADRQYFIEEVMDGRITVDEEGFPTIHTDHEHPKLAKVRFDRRPRGSAWTAMDRVKKDKEMGKIYAAMAAACGLTGKELEKLDAVDLESVQTVFMLFLGNRA
jgi:hypothetical protein